MSKKEDEIYEALTDNENVLAGLYAYSKYQEDKKTWIKEFRNNNTNKNKYPSEIELTPFYNKIKQPNVLKQYQEEGKRLRDLAIHQEYKKEIEVVRTACYKDIQGQVSSALNDQPVPSKWRGFGVNAFASFVGSVAIAVATALIVFFTILSDNEFRTLFYKKVGILISPQSESVGTGSSSSTNGEEEKNEKTAPFETSRPQTISNKEPSY